MKFIGDVNGSGATEVEADDAGEAAEALAEMEFDQGDPPSDNEYLVSVLSVEDGAFSVHCVTIEFKPTFSACASDEEPDEHVVDSLFQAAAKVRLSGKWRQPPSEGGSGSGGASGAAGGSSGAGGSSAASGGASSGTS